MNINTVHSAMLKKADRPRDLYTGELKLLPGDKEIVEAFKSDSLIDLIKGILPGFNSNYNIQKNKALWKYKASNDQDFWRLFNKYRDNYENKAIEIPQK